ncbi:MAG: hypothetical protein J0M12_06610 [Deltaproteobacteria bacterium]|nr:hypothetical protein [Deltaproteobacteria bacterium]
MSMLWIIILGALHASLGVLVLKNCRSRQVAWPFIGLLLGHLLWVELLVLWSCGDSLLGSRILLTRVLLLVGITLIAVCAEYILRACDREERLNLRYWIFQANNLVVLLLLPSTFIVGSVAGVQPQLGILAYYFAGSVLCAVGYIAWRVIRRAGECSDPFVRFRLRSLCRYSVAGLLLGVFLVLAFPMPSVAMSGSVIVEVWGTTLTIGAARMTSHGEVLYLKALLGGLLKLPEFSSDEARLRVRDAILSLARIPQMLENAGSVELPSGGSPLRLSFERPEFQGPVSDAQIQGIQDSAKLLELENARLEQGRQGARAIASTRAAAICKGLAKFSEPTYFESADQEFTRSLVSLMEAQRNSSNLETFDVKHRADQLAECVDTFLAKNSPCSLFLENCGTLDSKGALQIERLLNCKREGQIAYLSAEPGSLEENLEISEELYCRLRNSLVIASPSLDPITPMSLQRQAFLRHLRAARLRPDVAAQNMKITPEDVDQLLRTYAITLKEDSWWKLSQVL